MKKILLLLSVFLITGCSTKYNLEIKKDKLNEKIEINVPTNLSTEKKDELEKIFKNKIPTQTNTESLDIENYKVNKEFNKNGYKYIMTHQFKTNEFYNHGLLNDCFETFQYKETKSSIAIRAQGEFKCLYDNKNIKVAIKTDNYVSSNNANKIEGNQYIWNIKKEKDNNISLVVSKDIIVPKKGKTTIFDTIKNSIITILLIGSLIAGMLLINKIMKKLESI
ncbi:MAG: hypothetical protein RR500_03610 [Bacilli bacterium]